jgi:hypothetical protein
MIADFSAKLKTTTDVLKTEYKAEISGCSTNKILTFEIKAPELISAEIFSKYSIDTTYEAKNQIEIVVDKVSITNSDLNYDIFNIDKYIYYPCGEIIQKYQPIYYDPITKEVFVASYLEENHFKKYLGISLGNFKIGEMAKVQIFGILYDNSFNFDLNREIFVGEREITQDVSNPNIVYQQTIGNVLTEKTLYLNYNEPISFSLL